MLEIKVTIDTRWDETNEQFLPPQSAILFFEHNLRAIMDWETEMKKSYLSSGEKTPYEMKYYLYCMLQNKENSFALDYLTNQDMVTINNYINDVKTALYIPQGEGKSPFITSETMWYWIIGFKLPHEAQYWHVSRLMALAAYVGDRMNPNKKSESEVLRDYRALNAKRIAEESAKRGETYHG